VLVNALSFNGAFSGSFSGNGAALSGLNAASLTGTVPDARLSPNVALRAGGNAFTGNQTIAGDVGIGTANPNGTLHVYSTGNPTRLRLQSSGTPGFGWLEFVSNPLGDVNEWRPGLIKSTDAGNFTGGLSFVVNGSGAANKWQEWEVMRIQNGRVGILNPLPTAMLTVGAATCDGVTWNNTSDRNIKTNFAPVDAREILEKVVALSVQSWSYTNEVATRHVGPMAQDFYDIFNVGTDNKHIATVDTDGVALAAIQGLNQKVEAENRSLRAILQRKDAEIQELKEGLAEVRRLIGKQAK
jgi:hypothetical protein